jgi:SAM-dependent methyltransferase
MFDLSADYYDLIYRFKDYEAEATRVVERIRSIKPDCKTVLDVACGTGEHCRILKRHFEVEGVDINAKFVDLARLKNPDCRFEVADMRDFALNRRFDAVLLLFSSIGYARTFEAVVRTFACLRDHLAEGGVILVEPWFKPEAWKTGSVHLLSAERDDVKVCRMNTSETQDGCSYFKFHYLVGTPDGVTHFTEEHLLGLFTVEEMMRAFAEAGLSAEYEAEGLSGRGLYLARKLRDP